jgi:hypothetical protein
LDKQKNLTLKYPKKVEKGTGAPGEREQNQFPVFLCAFYGKCCVVPTASFMMSKTFCWTIALPKT